MDAMFLGTSPQVRHPVRSLFIFGPCKVSVDLRARVSFRANRRSTDWPSVRSRTGALSLHRLCHRRHISRLFAMEEAIARRGAASASGILSAAIDSARAMRSCLNLLEMPELKVSEVRLQASQWTGVSYEGARPRNTGCAT